MDDEQPVEVLGLDEADLQEAAIAGRANEHGHVVGLVDDADRVSVRVEDVLVGDAALAGAREDDGSTGTKISFNPGRYKVSFNGGPGILPGEKVDAGEMCGRDSRDRLRRGLVRHQGLEPRIATPG